MIKSIGKWDTHAQQLTKGLTNKIYVIYESVGIIKLINLGQVLLS